MDGTATKDTTGRHRVRAAALGAVAALAAVVAAYVAWHGMLGELHRLDHRSTVRTLDALPVLLWAALVLALLWAALLVALAAGTVLRGATGSAGEAACSGPPAGGRAGGLVARVAGVLLALTTLSGLSTAAPALAATTPTTATASVQVPPAALTVQHAGVPAGGGPCAEPEVPAPGWVPDKPARTDQLARDCAPLVTGRPVADDSGEVVVHRGDTLWSIAAAQLGPHADARAIAAEWPRWYAANRDTIGNDPDLLQIGTRLQRPQPALEGSNR